MVYFDNCGADQELRTVSGRSKKCFSFLQHPDCFQKATQRSTQWVMGDILQPHNQAMNMVGAVASIVGAYMNICFYIYIHIHILLCYTFYVYTLFVHTCKRCFFQDHKIKTLICFITFHKVSSICILLSK